MDDGFLNPNECGMTFAVCLLPYMGAVVHLLIIKATCFPDRSAAGLDPSCILKGILFQGKSNSALLAAEGSSAVGF